MLRNPVRSLAILILAGLAASAPAQFTPEEVVQRAALENFLTTAEIVKAEEVGEGVTKPIRLTLRKDGREERGVWKNPSGMQLGAWEGWQYEIAAYRMDKLLGLNMVPPTVEREYRGKRGSLQFWTTVATSLLKVMENNIPFPPEARDGLERAKYLTRAFDSLIANEDRTQQNVLYTRDWRCILIDHSRSFRKGPEYAERLLYGQQAKGRPLPFRRLPRAFVERIRSLTFESIRGAVGPYLNDEEINAVLARKALVLKEIDDTIRANGEAQVLY